MYSILSYGAIPDGKTLATKAFQAAVDACHEAGGGTVVVPAGTYLLGSITMKSGVLVSLEHGATLLGSIDYQKDYYPREEKTTPRYQDQSHSFFRHSLFYADGCHDIGFVGSGRIDMQGVWVSEEEGQYYRSVKTFAFKNCSHLLFRDFSVIDTTDLCLYLAGCEHVRIENLYMDVLVDGISPDGCRNVTIANCQIKAGDDAIVLKASYALDRLIHCENIAITGCLVSSHANAIKIGTETNGDFRNITVTGCCIYDTDYGGIAVESVDGSHISGLVFSGIAMRNVGLPFLFRLGSRMRAPEDMTIGTLENITVSSVVIDTPKLPYSSKVIHLKGQQWVDETTTPFPYTSLFMGIPDHPMRNLVFRDITMKLYGGIKADDPNLLTLPLPEKETAYPEGNMFGWKKHNPALAGYFRHIDGLTLDNITVEAYQEDSRPAFLFEDVTRTKGDAVGKEQA